MDFESVTYNIMRFNKYIFSDRDNNDPKIFRLKNTVYPAYRCFSFDKI